MKTIQVERAPRFRDLLGTDGRRYSLESFDDARLLVVVFVGNGCPTTLALEPWLLDFQKRYRPDGVQLVLMNSNNPALSPPDTFDEMQKLAAEPGFDFVYLKDADGISAREFGATKTPQAFVLDEDRRVRYRGRLADSRRPQAIRVPFMIRAVDDLLAEREVAIPEREPYGCEIVW